LFTEPCEAIFNEHPWISRSALVGVGPRERQTPVIIFELAKRAKIGNNAKPPVRSDLVAELRALGAEYPQTRAIGRFLIHPKFPVDIRHNAKIFREKLAVWAARKVH
jgi:hypothetical protein